MESESLRFLCFNPVIYAWCSPPLDSEARLSLRIAFYILHTQNVAPSTVAPAAAGRLLLRQHLRPHPYPLNQSLHFNKIPRWFACTLEFEYHLCKFKYSHILLTRDKMTYLVDNPLISDRIRLLLWLLILINSIYCVLIEVISWELLSPVLLFIHSKEGLLWLAWPLIFPT